MKRLVLLLCGVTLVAALSTALVGRLAPHDQVYSVAEVAAGLHQRPRAWIRRTVLVRGAIIWYVYDYFAPNGDHNSGQSGCFGYVGDCHRMMGLNLALVGPSSVVHAALAARFHSFTYVGGGLTPQHPPGTLSIRFHTPPISATTDPVPAFLRRWTVIRSLWPAPRSRGFDLSGVFRLHLVAHRNHGQRQWYDDAVALNVSP